MNEVRYYIPKTPKVVQAILYNGTTASNLAVSEWVTPLLSEQGKVIVGPTGSRLFIVEEGRFELILDRDTYLFLDADGLHAIQKGAFDLMMQAEENVV